MFDKLSPKSDLILLLEADTLPTDDHYIANLVAAIPPDGNFSYISGDKVPTPARNFFSRCMNIGFLLRKELFLSDEIDNLLYLAVGGRLFSKMFAKQFRWKNGYHEDSYCYRKAYESGMPVFFTQKAKTYFSSVDNLNDHLKQSSKYQKAREKEKSHSDIYDYKFSIVRIITVIFKYLFKYPITTSSYLLLFVYARLYAKFAKEYTQFWGIYSSSKDLANYAPKDGSQ